MGDAARVIPTSYSREEAAALLGVSVATLDRERIAGRLAWVRVRGRVVVTWDAIEQYRSAHEVRTSTSEAAPGGATSAPGSASPSAPATRPRRAPSSGGASPSSVRDLLGLGRKSAR